MPGERREPGVLRLALLAALCDRRLRDAFLVRAAGLYGWGVVASFALLIALDRSATLSLLGKALVTLAWVPGVVVAFAAARDGGGSDEASGLLFLARQRGFDHRELAWARVLGAALCIGRALAVRTLVLSAFAASRAIENDGRWGAVGWVFGALSFSVVAGVLLAALARGAAFVLPERGRFVFSVLVLLPLAASTVWPGTPNLPLMVRELVPGLLGGGA